MDLWIPPTAALPDVLDQPRLCMIANYPDFFGLLVNFDLQNAKVYNFALFFGYCLIQSRFESGSWMNLSR